MYNIYVPFENINDYVCYSFNEDGSVIYAFKDFPIDGNTYNVDKVFVNNHYSIVNSNIQVNSSDINCISSNNLTNNWTYRNDLDSILISLFFFVMFFFGIPLFLLSRFFKKRY